MLGTARDYFIKLVVLAKNKTYGGKVAWQGSGWSGYPEKTSLRRQCYIMARKMSKRQPSHVGKSRGWRRAPWVEGIARAKVLRRDETDILKELNCLCGSRFTEAEGEQGEGKTMGWNGRGMSGVRGTGDKKDEEAGHVPQLPENASRSPSSYLRIQIVTL